MLQCLCAVYRQCVKCETAGCYMYLYGWLKQSLVGQRRNIQLFDTEWVSEWLCATFQHATAVLCCAALCLVRSDNKQQDCSDECVAVSRRLRYPSRDVICAQYCQCYLQIGCACMTTWVQFMWNSGHKYYYLSNYSVLAVAMPRAFCCWQWHSVLLS